MKRFIEMVLVVMILVALTLVFCGCQETQQSQQKVWGTGDPPVDWQETFGNENMARLNYVQTQRINTQGQAMAELVERVRQLEEAQIAKEMLGKDAE